MLRGIRVSSNWTEVKILLSLCVFTRPSCIRGNLTDHGAWSHCCRVPHPASQRPLGSSSLPGKPNQWRTQLVSYNACLHLLIHSRLQHHWPELSVCLLVWRWWFVSQHVFINMSIKTMWDYVATCPWLCSSISLNGDKCPKPFLFNNVNCISIRWNHSIIDIDFTCKSSQSTSLLAGTTDLKVFRWWSLSLKEQERFHKMYFTEQCRWHEEKQVTVCGFSV